MVPSNAIFKGYKAFVDHYPFGEFNSGYNYLWPASFHVKIGASGPPVISPWGPWKPVRPYKRAGTVLRLSGSYCIEGTTQDVWSSPQWSLTTGFPPYVSDPLTALLNRMKSGSGDVIDNSRFPVLTQNTRNRLITECILKVGDRKANYGEAIAEGRKTLSDIAKTSMRVLRAYKALRRGRFRDFVKELGVSPKHLRKESKAADVWLSYQYAWLPLLNDIYDSYNVLRNGIDRKSLILRGVRQLTEESDYKDSYVNLWDMEGSVMVRHRCLLFYRLTNSTADSFYSLGLINPLEVAWAVVPYSFVIDWFLPVGNVLEAFSALQGLTFVDGCITSKVEISAQGKFTTFNAVTPYHETDFTWSFEHFAMERSQIVSPPIPAIYVKSPFSSTHAVSALALLQTLRR